MVVPKVVISRWRMIAGAVVGAAAGVLLAVACIRHGAGGGETQEGAFYLIAFFGFPTSFLLARVPYFGQIVHLSQFAFAALPLNYALLGLVVGGLWHRLVTHARRAA